MKYATLSSKLILCLLVTVLLTGCDATRRSLGMERKSPEAFDIGNHDALIIPPNFHLRPPVDEKSPAVIDETSPAACAENESTSHKKLSPAEKNLLKKAGYNESLPAEKKPSLKPVREKEMVETGPLQNIMPKKPLSKEKSKKNPDILDADAETKRLANEDPVSQS